MNPRKTYCFIQEVGLIVGGAVGLRHAQGGVDLRQHGRRGGVGGGVVAYGRAKTRKYHLTLRPAEHLHLQLDLNHPHLQPQAGDTRGPAYTGLFTCRFG